MLTAWVGDGQEDSSIYPIYWHSSDAAASVKAAETSQGRVLCLAYVSPVSTKGCKGQNICRASFATVSFSLSPFKYFPCFRPHSHLHPPHTHWLPQLLLNWKSLKCEWSPHPSSLMDTPPHASATTEPTTSYQTLPVTSSSSYNWYELPSGPWLSGVCTLTCLSSWRCFHSVLYWCFSRCYDGSLTELQCILQNSNIIYVL